jgi:hypothetical protein
MREEGMLVCHGGGLSQAFPIQRPRIATTTRLARSPLPAHLPDWPGIPNLDGICD